MYTIWINNFRGLFRWNGRDAFTTAYKRARIDRRAGYYPTYRIVDEHGNTAIKIRVHEHGITIDYLPTVTRVKLIKD